MIRWFEGPDYLTIQALGTDEERDVPPSDAWYPLEWPNESWEIARADAILENKEVAAASAALEAELEDGSWPWEERQPDTLVAAAAKIRDLLDASGVSLPDHFAVGVCHFEGWGAADSVPCANPPPVVELLRQRGLDPRE